MKIATNIAAGLLGLLFLAGGLTYFLGMMPPMPAFPAGSYPALFMGALGPSGYMGFVKAMELLGGVLVAIPRTRNLGLLVLGPIIINILAYSVFIMKGEGLFSAPILLISFIAAFLLWSGRKAFAALVG